MQDSDVTEEEAKDESRDLLFDRRKNKATESCSSMMYSPENGVQTQEPMVLMGTKKSFVFCAVAKCGTSFWRRMLALIENDRNYTDLYDGHHIESLPTIKEFRSSHTPSKTVTFMENANTFTFVREPYGRLFAAYIGKLFGPNLEFWTGEGRAIITTLRKDADPLSAAFGHDVTFAELVKFVLLQYKNNFFIDRHFAPMHSRCNPCSTKFDYVGKLETFKDDAAIIIDKISASSSKEYRNILMMEKEALLFSIKGRMDALFEVFAEADSFMHDEERIEKLKYQLFLRVWRSFQIRGKLSVETEMPLKPAEVLKKNQSELQYLLITAFDRPITTDVTWQRRDALLQAYQTVSPDDLESLKKYLEADCDLFGYEKEPKWLFGKPLAQYRPIFDYFDTQEAPKEASSEASSDNLF